MTDNNFRYLKLKLQWVGLKWFHTGPPSSSIKDFASQAVAAESPLAGMTECNKIQDNKG